MSALKRVAGVSLYHQIMEDLRKEVQGMAYGEQIETEQQLAEKYAVSRGTVRQAITALVNEGLLTKIQGKGTFKSGVALDRSTAVVKSFTDQLLASGLVPGIRDVRLESDFADERTAKHLGLAPGTPIWRLSRVRLADGVPISYCTAYINPVYAAGLRADDLEMSLIAMFTEKLGVPLRHGESFVTATLASEELARRLGVSTTTPILRLEHVGFLASGDPVFFDVTDSIGERYVMQIEQGSYGRG
ncbi:GntR family transcriptional regulator [uncultured Anaerotruncus sp.]|uniref:GntR family transcriptional regulator n=1 Tax=uncultured Anaerotruncus sp. TaxID=905011 RepID=UPI00280B6FBE|nr:GntR family transcriptional regulator [uncultured Anaerotruncus sp.]